MTRRYLLDTNAVADLIYNRRDVRKRIVTAKANGARIGTCPPVIGELYAGAMASQSKDRNIRELDLGLRGLTIWPYHIREAILFGQLWAELKRLGRPMQVVDVQLASAALSLGDCTVVTSDADLRFVPGLLVENWATGA